jgi:glycosyltransferase involved in cell wall biosynthesis
MIDEKKILILLFYYNRPTLVKTALQSIKNHNYSNWELAFIDDGSEEAGKPIVMDMFPDDLEKIRFYNTNDSIEDKINRNGVDGSIFGKYAQLAIEESTADYVIMLCDDDALYPEYFKNLNKYFEEHPDEHYVYSHIHIYDPTIERIQDDLPYEHHHLNKTENLNPYFKIDMSQVAWRRNSFISANIKFPYPMTANLDAAIYIQMHSAFGDCKFSGFKSEYKAMDKGFYKDQLSHRMGRRLAGINTPQDVYTITVK